MGIRSETLEINKKIALEKIIEMRKTTISKLSKKLGWSVGKTQGIINHLLKEKKIMDTPYPDYEKRKFKVYYSTDPLNLPNTIQPTHEKEQVIPEYHQFLEQLFTKILTSDKSDVLIEFIDEMGLTIEEIEQMMLEAKKE